MYSRVLHGQLDTGEHPSKRAALSVAACHLRVSFTGPPPPLLGASRVARLRIRPLDRMPPASGSVSGEPLFRWQPATYVSLLRAPLPRCWERPEWPACEFDLQDLTRLISWPKSAARAPRLLVLSRAQFGMERPGWPGHPAGPGRKILRVTQRRPTPSRRVRVLRMAPQVHACLGIPQPATADHHWRAPPSGRVPWRATRAHVASPRRGPKGAPQACLQAPQSRIVGSKGRRAHGTRAPNSPSGDRA